MHLLVLAGLLLPTAGPEPGALSPDALLHTPSALQPSVTAPAATPLAAADELFAPATEDLVISWSDGSSGLTLLNVMTAYGSVTGQRLAISEETREILGALPAPVDRATVVPAAEVQGFVEAMLRASYCVLTVDRTAEPRLVGVHSLEARSRSGIRARAVLVTSDQIERMRAHPAVLFTTALDLPHLEVRQIANSMRTLIVDANTTQMLPAGNHTSMILVGFGPEIANRIEQLRAVDRASANARASVAHEFISLANADAAQIASIVEVALNGSQSMGEFARGSNPAQPMGEARVQAVARLNGLLITCRGADMAEAKRIVALLDVEK